MYFSRSPIIFVVISSLCQYTVNVAAVSDATVGEARQPEEVSTVTWGHTHLEVDNFRYTWTIDKFSYHRLEPGYYIKSPVFGVEGSHDSQFQLVLTVTPKENKEFVSIYIDLIKTKDPNFRLQFDVFMKGNKTYQKTDDRFHSYNVSTDAKLPGYTTFIEKSQLYDKTNGYLINDRVMIICQGKIILGTVQTAGKNLMESYRRRISCSSFDNLVRNRINEDTIFRDVKLTAGGKEFYAHKIILAAQSPFLKAVFEEYMNFGQNSSWVDVPDMDDDIFEALLDFIYTGKGPIDDKMAERLIEPADNYGLEKLKTLCEYELVKNLSVDNAVDYLILAYKSNADGFKETVMKFIVDRAHEFVKMHRFDMMLKQHEQLAADVFQTLAKNHDSLKFNRKPIVHEDY